MRLHILCPISLFIRGAICSNSTADITISGPATNTPTTKSSGPLGGFTMPQGIVDPNTTYATINATAAISMNNVSQTTTTKSTVYITLSSTTTITPTTTVTRSLVNSTSQVSQQSTPPFSTLTEMPTTSELGTLSLSSSQASVTMTIKTEALSNTPHPTETSAGAPQEYDDDDDQTDRDEGGEEGNAEEEDVEVGEVVEDLKLSDSGKGYVVGDYSVKKSVRSSKMANDIEARGERRIQYTGRVLVRWLIAHVR